MEMHRTHLTDSGIRIVGLSRLWTAGLVAVVLVASVAVLGASPQRRAAAGLTHRGNATADVILAMGQVKAAGIGTHTVQIPIGVISSGARASTGVDVDISAQIVDFDDGKVPKKLFKSMSITLQRNGATVANGTAKLTAADGGATIEFSDLEVASGDNFEAILTFNGGTIRDAFVIVTTLTSSAPS